MVKQVRNIPAVGMVLVCVLSADAFLLCSEELFCALGGVFYIVYKPMLTMWKLLRIFPGIILLPALMVVFCVQMIRCRKNRSYIKNCILSIAACVLLILSGSIMKIWVVPLAADGLIEMKLSLYKAAVTELHAGGESKDRLTGGVDGHEDVAFYQYTAYYKWWDEQENASRTRDIYILYSEDDHCDIEALLLPEHSICHTELYPIQEKWYELIVENYFYP